MTLVECRKLERQIEALKKKTVANGCTAAEALAAAAAAAKLESTAGFAAMKAYRARMAKLLANVKPLA